MVRCGLDSPGSGWGPLAASFEHGNDPWGSVIGWEFLNYLNDYQLSKKDFTQWN
jgi:hypothetical protein